MLTVLETDDMLAPLQGMWGKVVDSTRATQREILASNSHNIPGCVESVGELSFRVANVFVYAAHEVVYATTSVTVAQRTVKMLCPAMHAMLRSQVPHLTISQITTSPSHVTISPHSWRRRIQGTRWS